MSRRLVVALALLIWQVAVLGDGSLRIHFLDVGQGDAVLMQSPSGQAVLYDAGESPERVVSHLRALGISKLDLVIASHNHADHIGGLPEVIRRFRPRFYMENGIAATTQIYSSVLQAVHDSNVQVLDATHRQVRLGSDAVLTILPPPGFDGRQQNNNTVGAVLSYGSFRLSLGGDAEQAQWDWWAEHYPTLLAHVQVHKASHHGSNQGDTPAALARLSPEVVAIGVGLNNLFRHPRPEALGLYRAQNSRVYRTDLNGTILVEAEASGRYTVRVEKSGSSFVAEAARNDRPNR